MSKLTIHGAEQAVTKAIFSALTEAKAMIRLEELMDAETTVRVRGDTGEGITYERVPDNPVRLAAAVKIIEWNRGKPRQSVEVTKGPAEHKRLTSADLAKMIRNNPAVIDDFIGSMKTAQTADIQASGSYPHRQPTEKESGGSHSSVPLSVQELSKADGREGARPAFNPLHDPDGLPIFTSPSIRTPILTSPSHPPPHPLFHAPVAPDGPACVTDTPGLVSAPLFGENGQKNPDKIS